LSRVLSKMTAADLDYGDLLGYPPLRSAIAEYLQISRAVICDASQVVIVPGAQYALHLIARVLLNASDTVWIEEPHYLGARNVFQSIGARLVPLPVDNEGVNLAAVAKNAPRPKVIYVTPSHQFPLGFTMSLSRRLSLLEHASRFGSWIVEDDYDGEIRYEGRPLSALQGLDPDRRVIYVGTFSKSVFPAIRLGYLVVPKELIIAVKKSRQATHFCPPYLYQAALAEFISTGHFAHHLQLMKRVYNSGAALW